MTLKVKETQNTWLISGWSPVELVPSALLPASRNVLSSLLKLRLWFHHRGWDALKPQSPAVTTVFSSTNRCLIIFGPDVAPGECGCLSPAAGSPDLHQASGVSRYLERMWLMIKHDPVFLGLAVFVWHVLTSFLIASSHEHYNSLFAARERVRRLQITCTFPHSHAYIANTAFWNGLSFLWVAGRSPQYWPPFERIF